MRPTRRNLLAALAAGLGGLGVSPGLTAAEVRDRRKLIVVWANGGWDVTYVFDPKLGVPTVEGPEFFDDPTDFSDRNEVRSYGELRVVTNDHRRPSVSRFFELNAHRAAIVNGVYVGSIAHDPCKLRMLTGTKHEGAADVAVITGAADSDDLPLGSVDLSGFSFAGPLAVTAGRIGNGCQIVSLLRPTRIFPAPDDAGLVYPQFVSAPADAGALEEIRLARLARLRSGWTRAGEATRARLDAYAPANERARRFSEDATGILEELTLGLEPNTFDQAEIATELLRNGVCRAVVLDTNRRWDTHLGNDQQDENFEDSFYSLGFLMNLLDEKGLADSTTVVAMSEMTRTPRHNLDLGKDHWQHTSMLAVGAGVRPGQYGGTDDLLESLPMDLGTGEVSSSGALCRYDNLAAGILRLCGVESEPWLPGVVPFTGFVA